MTTWHITQVNNGYLLACKKAERKWDEVYENADALLSRLKELLAEKE